MITLTKVTETTSTFTLGWEPVAGAIGYRFIVDGKVSHTFDPTRDTVKVAKGATRVTVEAMGTLDTGVWPTVTPPPPPPPPTGFSSPLGYHSNRAPGHFPPSNVDKYGYISSEGPAPTAFQGRNDIYRSGITCGYGYTNIHRDVAVANNYHMLGTDGQPLRNGGYGGTDTVLGDPGLPAYQQAWCQAALARARELQADGFWIDDTTPRVSDFSGTWPAKYPTLAQYQEALLSFARFAKTFFAAEGLKTTYNTGISVDDNASLTINWWQRIGLLTDSLTQEYWIALGDGTVRKSGSSNWNYWWEQHRSLHTVCQQAGCSFLPLSSGHGQVYTLATFLLDWNGTGSNSWVPSDQYNTTTDVWRSEYAVAATLDSQAPAATKSGNVWSRWNGRVKVDPVAGTASIV